MEPSQADVTHPTSLAHTNGSPSRLEAYAQVPSGAKLAVSSIPGSLRFLSVFGPSQEADERASTGGDHPGCARGVHVSGFSSRSGVSSDSPVDPLVVSSSLTPGAHEYPQPAITLWFGQARPVGEFTRSAGITHEPDRPPGELASHRHQTADWDEFHGSENGQHKAIDSA